jgi:two-component system cell cycle response regulator
MRIVLVEPSRTLTKVIRRLLEAAGHKVRTFADGPEAFAYVRSESSIDAIITAGELPSMSGQQLCGAVRALANDKRPIYILLMSSNSDDKRMVHALNLGADDFIHKPPNAEELHARLRAAERFVGQQRKLIQLANTDSLTGLRNRRSFFEMAETIVGRTTLVSAIMIDIDHFKRINDSFGHEVGNQVLRMVATAAQSSELIVGRLGGEEFGIILEGKNILESVQVADALRMGISNLRLETEQGAIAVTCSFGVSERQSQEPIDPLFRRADIALYQAKEGGRNRVCAATHDGGIEKPPGSVVRYPDRPKSISVPSDLSQQSGANPGASSSSSPAMPNVLRGRLLKDHAL